MCCWGMAAGLPGDIWALPPLPPLQSPACSLCKLLWAYLDSKEEVLQAAKGPPGACTASSGSVPLLDLLLQAWGECSNLTLTGFPCKALLYHLINPQERSCQ